MSFINLTLLTDEELIKLVQKHKYKAFRELVVRYSSDLCIFSYYFVYDIDMIKCLLKKVFIDVWCRPYLYIKNFKITIYKKIIKELLNEGINKKISSSNEYILLNIANKDLLAINLYYFSTLEESEIRLLDNKMMERINNLNKKFIEKYGVDLNAFVSSIKMDNISTSNFQKEIIFVSTKYQQKDKYQNAIIAIAVLLLLMLFILLTYSVYIK